MFRRVDDFLIDRVFQPQVNEFQARTKKNNFELVAVLLLLVGLCACARFAVLYFENKEISITTFAIPFLVLSGSYFAMRRGNEMRQGKTFSGVRFDPMHYLTRMLISLLTVSASAAAIKFLLNGENQSYLVSAIFTILFWACLYVEACEPKKDPTLSP